MKKFLWTLTVALTSTAMAALTVRILDRAYRRFAQEPPPEMPRWARFMVAPIKRPVAHAVEP